MGSEYTDHTALMWRLTALLKDVFMSGLIIEVTRVTHVRDKNSNIQGGLLSMI